VLGDPLRLRQILFNLIGNAIKFTASGEVEVSCRLEPPHTELPRPHIRLEVRDTGIGIPADKLARIFESFWQADASTTRQYGGTGLGTTISRDLTRLMGGSIGVQSREGEGSRFIVRLPLLPEGHRPAPPYPLVPAGYRVILHETNAAGRAAVAESCRLLGVHWRALESLAARGNGAFDDLDRDADLLILADSPAGEDLERIKLEVTNRLGRDIPTLFLTYAGRRLDSRLSGPCLSKPFYTEQLTDAVRDLLQGSPAAPGERTSADLASPLPPAPRGYEVLVAEDNPIASKVIVTFLEMMGDRKSVV
jgi:two-component system sensor histidine kinase RpfC